MTEKQALDRWKFRHDFLEEFIVTGLVLEGTFTDKQAARDWIREKCEEALQDAGFKYPIEETSE